MGMKWCKRCERDKDDIGFEGKLCLDCKILYHKEYHLKHRDKHRAMSKKRYEANKDTPEFIAYVTKYRAEHREESIAYLREYYAENKEEKEVAYFLFPVLVWHRICLFYRFGEIAELCGCFLQAEVKCRAYARYGYHRGEKGHYLRSGEIGGYFRAEYYPDRSADRHHDCAC